MVQKLQGEVLPQMQSAMRPVTGFNGDSFNHLIVFVGVLTVLCTKGIDGLLKLRSSWLEERKYEDTEVKEARGALVTELKNRVNALEEIVRGQGEAKVV